jgi:hypothetical protein
VARPGEAHEEVPRRLFGFVEFAVVDHIDDSVGCADEHIGLIVVTKGVAAEIALSVGVVVVGGGSEPISGVLCMSGASIRPINVRCGYRSIDSAATYCPSPRIYDSKSLSS